MGENFAEISGHYFVIRCWMSWLLEASLLPEMVLPEIAVIKSVEPPGIVDEVLFTECSSKPP